MTVQIAIVGGSLAGLGAANVLLRLGYSVKVFEKFSTTFEDRGSSLGYVDVPRWEYLRGAPMIRYGQRANRAQGAYFYGDLWKFLYDGLPEGTVRFGYTVNDLGTDNMRPTIDGKVYDMVVIADGGFSSLRRYVNGSVKQPEYAGHLIFRAKLALDDFPGFGAEGIYENGRCFAIALNVARCNGTKYIMGGVAMGAPESEIVRPTDGANRQDMEQGQAMPDWFLPYVRRKFRHHGGGQLLRWLELAAVKGKITPQPLFEFMADEVSAGRIVMIGDAAHMASPRTAAGAHTGILDALGLLEAFSANKHNIDDAIRAYAVGGRQRARDLYLRSKEVSRPLVYVPEYDDRRDEL
jgi:2-polyprenyl-6-methoxyphenol hydroxylase-like FAD-dependent oxidoreductase